MDTSRKRVPFRSCLPSIARKTGRIPLYMIVFAGNQETFKYTYIIHRPVTPAFIERTLAIFNKIILLYSTVPVSERSGAKHVHGEFPTEYFLYASCSSFIEKEREREIKIKKRGGEQ